MVNSSTAQFELEGRRIFVAGHRGMVGAAVVRQLEKIDCEILTVGRDELDLRRQGAVEEWVMAQKPHVVVLAAARVGGILANDSYPADFLHDNLVIQNNVIHAAYLAGVEKLLFLGSSCIYPKLSEQPIVEDELLSGPLESTNQWYAVAKIAGLMTCRAYRRQHGCDYISAMPTNLYGPGDNYDLDTSHVVPALIGKAHAAKVNGDAVLKVWGTGQVRREFLHVDDAAASFVYMLRHYSGETHLNVGAGKDISIEELAGLICDIVGFDGKLVFDAKRPDGMPRKLLDSTRFNELGWQPSISLRDGLADAYLAYQRDVLGVEPPVPVSPSAAGWRGLISRLPALFRPGLRRPQPARSS